MLDRTGEWCFEGGCTYLNMTERSDMREDETASEELAALYREPCLGMYD
ncbi:hypothetical protein GURASL_10770 [Geotalea uraniireducens]|uniref:Uncharacterized protein n=1 Tax=Geotalea uraniireducens TaxID=351604 RepID=A0ABM8EIS5_9BACT|nr:hypothetical protein [Geotalea uraniireducens]BDV42154.1 hypothetical protein GURASL_10770 [Geotalea uraniireducens]